MFRILIGLLLVGVLNGHPFPPESDEITTARSNVIVNEVVTLSLELLPPKIDAENTDFGLDNIDENVTLSTDLLPPMEDENTTLSTDLLPPKEDEDSHKHGVVFVINLFALGNDTTVNTTDLINDEIKEKVPGILEPYATILLVVEDDDETVPVDLNELAKDLQEEGVFVEKYGDDIDNKVIRIDFEGDSSNEDPDIEVLQANRMSVTRKKRSPHLLKKLKKMKMMGGGGCNVCQQAPPPCMTCNQPQPCMTCGPPPPPPCSGCGCGGCAPPPRPPPQQCMTCGGPPPQQHSISISPIIIRWEQRPPQMNSCNTCGGGGGGGYGGGGGGGYGGGGQGYHGSYSQASAQASSNSW